MDKNVRKSKLRKAERYLPTILISLFACAFLIATTAALVTTIKWHLVTSTSQITPNGTPGSAQPGTIGLARPHPPMHVQ